jgi:HK97 family phage prohead protease
MNISEKILERQKSVPAVGRKEFAVTKADIMDDEKHVIRVKFASFGNKDSAGDILVKGCFAKSINERGPQSDTNRKIAFLWQHDIYDPIGKVLEIEELDDGAYATVQLSNFDAVPNAKRAWYQLNDGDINQFSFGFQYVWDKMEYIEEEDAFLIKEVVLHEISVVTLGCNEQTEYMGAVKGLAEAIMRGEKVDKEQIKRMLEMLSGAEPAGEPLTRKSVFERIGQNV